MLLQPKKGFVKVASFRATHSRAMLKRTALPLEKTLGPNRKAKGCHLGLLGGRHTDTL